MYSKSKEPMAKWDQSIGPDIAESEVNYTNTYANEENLI